MAMTYLQASPAVVSSQMVNILLVDDETKNLDVLESVLQSPEYRLIRALSGSEALLALMKDDFAAIVLDIQMPELTGIELARLIKQRRRNQHIPILFLTAYYLRDTEILEGYTVGAVDYLTKPINPQILKSKIEVFVELFRSNRALAQANQTLQQEISQRKEAQEALRQINSELEVRVLLRTEELSLANLALRRSEEQFRRAIEDAPIPVIMQTEDGEVLQISKTWTLMTGYALEDAPAFGTWLTRAYGIGGNEMRDSVRSLFAHQSSVGDLEFEIVTRAGEKRIWSFSASAPGTLYDGRRFIVGMANDITERKQAEEALKIAKDAAESASKAKDDFLATLSHELRTPLNPALLLASERERDDSLPSEVQRDFATIRKEIEMEARLIDDLLDLTRISRGKLNLLPRLGELRPLLEASWRRLKLEAMEKQLEVRFDWGDHNPSVEGDPVRLQQVFWNVFRNAIRFTPAKGNISIRTYAENPKSCCVEVTDSGIGIEQAELSRVFIPFEQGEGARALGGLGLGLAISKQLVELHGGRIEVESQGRDRGASFRIYLPTASSSADRTQKTTGSPAGATRPKVSRRILLVEDHQQTRNTLARLLTQRGHEVATATNIEEALLCAESFPFDLLLSDLGLPDGSGHDLIVELRRKRNDFCGIALSGYGMDSDIDQSLKAGFQAHLTKPVDIKILEDILSQSNEP